MGRVGKKNQIAWIGILLARVARRIAAVENVMGATVVMAVKDATVAVSHRVTAAVRNKVCSVIASKWVTPMA